MDKDPKTSKSEFDVASSPTRLDGDIQGEAKGVERQLRRLCPQCHRFFDGTPSRCPDDESWLLELDVGEGERIGEVIESRLTLLGLVGSGGMATVYRAFQHSMMREVAVKLMHPSYSRDERQVLRFLQESKSASRLAHPNIITLFDFGQTPEGELYLVMELLKGRTLTQIIHEEGPLDVERALAIVFQVCDALHAAHQSEVVHRDIKPDNIFIVRGAGFMGEFVKVIDFGLAKIAQPQGVAKISQTGAVSGTPAYMSPEQIVGQPVDARSDVYALGIVLYEMLTGRPPFVASQVAKMLIAQVTEDPEPLGGVNPDTSRPVEVDATVLEALEKNPEDRPSSAMAFKRKLKRAFGRRSSVGAPSLSQAPPVTLDGRASLPGEPSTFVGREEVLDTLDAMIVGGERLVTIVGPGGMGKTRLALRLASAHLHNSNGQLWSGIWFCDLREARSLEELCHVVARTLGVPVDEGRGVRAVVEQLGAAIAARGRALLILDNFEQLVEWASLSVVRWLEAAPKVCLVVSSREPLRVAGESIFELPPLTVPEPAMKAIPGATSEAEQLFIERAQCVRSSWAHGGDDIEHIAEIVRRLEGVPLAIELAAARMSILSPAKILARLERQLDLLTRKSAQIASQHASLRAAIEWSWELLEPWERSTLAQLSVFCGGFSLEAAESVVDLDSSSGDLPWVGDILESLQERSLLQVVEEQASDGELRFGLLECIRGFAAEKLEASGDVESCQRRHAEFYTSLCSQWAHLGEKGGQAPQLAQLALERENMMAIPRRVAELSAPTPTDALAALEAVLCLDPVLSTSGPFNTHLELLDHVISLADERGAGYVPLGKLARALHARAEARRTRGRFAESVADCQRALTLARAAADRWVEGRVLWNLGAVADSEGRLEEAIEILQRALVIQREVGDRIAEGKSYGLLGVITLWLTRYDESREYLQRAQVVLHEQEDLYEAVFLGCLAAVNQETGALNEARMQYERAITALREIGSRRHEGMFLGYLGGLEWEQHRQEQAKRRLNEASEIAREVGDRMHVALFIAMLAAIDASDDRLHETARGFDAAEAVLHEFEARDEGSAEPYRTAIQLHRSHLDLALSRRAELTGPGEEAARSRATAQRRINAAQDPDAPTARSDDVRFALRMLRRAMEL